MNASTANVITLPARALQRPVQAAGQPAAMVVQIEAARRASDARQAVQDRIEQCRQLVERQEGFAQGYRAAMEVEIAELKAAKVRLTQSVSVPD